MPFHNQNTEKPKENVSCKDAIAQSFRFMFTKSIGNDFTSVDADRIALQQCLNIPGARNKKL